MDVEAKTASSPSQSVNEKKFLRRGLSSTSDHGTAGVGSVAVVDEELAQLGYKPELMKNRSMMTLLFQSLAIAAIRTSFLT